MLCFIGGKMFKKLNQMLENGLITKKEYSNLVQQLRNKKIENDLKSINKAIKSIKPIEYINYPIDNTYLLDLIDDIDFNINNDYIIGLKNLLTDNNLVYNTIGLKIIIAKYLLTIDLKDLKILKVDNNRLNKDFKFLVFKNGKIKFYTKLYFNNENNFIIFNTLNHDDIKSVIIYHKDLKNIENIIYNDITTDDITTDNITTDDITTDDIKKYQYRYYDKENKVINYLLDLIQILKYFPKTVNNKDIIKISKNITTDDIIDNMDKYYNIILTYENIYYPYDRIYNKFEYIVKYFKDNEKFKSNDLIDDIDDYYTLENSKGFINYKSNKSNNHYRKYLTKKMIHNQFIKGNGHNYPYNCSYMIYLLNQYNNMD